MENKAATLLQRDQRLFHTADLALLWDIANRNTLYTTIKRYIQRDILHRVHKGLYSTVPPEQLPPLQLMQRSIHRYAYLSTESVLVDAGVIFQDIQYTTFVSSVSRKFTVCGHACRVRKLKDTYLFNDRGVRAVDGILRATTERAVTDLLYFNPNYYFDRPKGIDWEEVKKIQQTVYDA